MNENDELRTSADDSVATEETSAAPTGNSVRGKKHSGAYWYTIESEEVLSRNSTVRTLIHVIALMLQITVLALPQGGLEYVTLRHSSYAFVYMWAVIGMLIASIYIVIADCTRYRLKKRIPVERAPRNGFSRRAFLTSEIDIGINALIFVLELSFVCIHYDGIGLVGMFLTAAATGLSVWGRQVEHLTLKNAELIPPPDESSENSDENN